MTKDNSLDYISLTSTIFELNKIGETVLAGKLISFLSNNELPKPELHNKKNDQTTSYYSVTITEEEKEKIVDLFLDLEVGHLSADGEATAAASHYSDMADRWSSIAAG